MKNDKASAVFVFIFYCNWFSVLKIVSGSFLNVKVPLLSFFVVGIPNLFITAKVITI